jgi:hypothetical protein
MLPVVRRMAQVWHKVAGARGKKRSFCSPARVKELPSLELNYDTCSTTNGACCLARKVLSGVQYGLCLGIPSVALAAQVFGRLYLPKPRSLMPLLS